MSVCSPFALRPRVSSAALTAGATLAALAQPVAAQAQSVDRDGSETLEPISVEGMTGGRGTGNANAAPTNIGRLPATVRETPRVVNVVPREQLQQQNVTSVEQALRNVPGITLSSGEGNGGQNGDQFRIRGFQSKGDVYIDGLRDFGAYVRDSFNLESVEVFKGPNGENFGGGTSGGLINQTTKRPFLEDYVNVNGSLGTGLQKRATIDVNKTINDTTAIRLNGVVHDQDIADRDRIFSKREGFSAALGMGLGTDHTWIVDYAYQHHDRAPDFGVPFVFDAGGRGTPATERGLGRSTSYIRSTDMDETNAHVVTSKFNGKVNDWLTFSNDSRVGFYDRDFSSTNPACSNDANGNAAGAPYAGSCSQLFLAGGNPNIGYGAGGGSTYFQESYGLQNISTMKAEFETGGLRHKAQAGVDIYLQNDERNPANYAGRPIQTIENPVYDASGAVFTRNRNNLRKGRATDVALFAADRVWFTEQWSAQGALRWDNFRSRLENQTPAAGAVAAVDTDARQKSSEISPSAALFFEPTKEQTYYVSFARSYVPIGINVSTQQVGGTSEAPREDLDLKPEKSDLYEIGGKIDVLDGKLGLSGAVFEMRKSNTFDTAENGDIVAGFSDSGQRRRVRGFELGATGKITDAWSLQAGYAYLDGKITGEALAAGAVSVKGNDAPFVSDHNFVLWTTYELSKHFEQQTPGKLTVGGGVQYATAYWADAANTARVPNYFSLDGLISYEYKGVRTAINAYNLTNELNYSAAFNSARAVPSSGRTVLVSLGYTW